MERSQLPKPGNVPSYPPPNPVCSSLDHTRLDPKDTEQSLLLHHRKEPSLTCECDVDSSKPKLQANISADPLGTEGFI